MDNRPIEDLEKQLSDVNDLENKVIMDDAKRQLYSALNTINAEYHSILYLLYSKDMSYEEAAVVLKKNSKQIKNLAYRAKQALKVTMETGGFCNEK